MKKNLLLLVFLFFVSFAASAQLADNSAEATFQYSRQSLKIFPNPATEYFQLTDRSRSVAQINIYSIVGKKMKTFQAVDGKKYNLNNFPKGLYLVQLIGHDNKTISTQRLNVRKP
ncbi:MAG TPA: T9SS type A sorting domain-containing protein [Phaeodactylibacter sp.]|nr:T9SS type A sorting domain-containing protein [Phaeodactylibacter sp.]